ncbi:glycosyltransferase [Chloroflexota bacterium]
MNILHITPYFVPAWYYGGPVQVAYGVSKELVKRGHKVTVYTTDTLNANGRIGERKEAIDGIEVKRFRNLSNSIAYSHKIFLSPGMLPAIRKEISSFDIIHMHEYRTVQNVIVHHYTRKRGIPYILQAHGSLPRTTAKLRLKQVFDAIWGYQLLEDAARVIALNETEARQYQAMGARQSKIEIVPNGVDPREFENIPGRGEFRKKYGLDGNHRIVLYLGRVHESKGLDLLIRAFASLSREMDSARLVIVGPDVGYSSELAELAQDLGTSDKILFTGPVYERGRLEAYVDADIFVTPSFLGFPVTFVEACACGTPIITTEKSDRLDWLDNHAGLVVAYDENQLKDALAKVLNDKDLARLFGENGKRLVREKFSWSKIAEGLGQIYREAITSYQ